MDVFSVSLNEVLAAASMRAASLVPETSGYLALAVADASARLPFRLDDAMVTLTTEGSVTVARGSQVVQPEESARRIRDMLARLLGCSIGSAPALAAAARPRSESGEGVDAFIQQLEAALVPVNRAAARRALARLARETARARDGGRLRRRRSRRTAEAPAPVEPASAIHEERQPERASEPARIAYEPPLAAEKPSVGKLDIDVVFSPAPVAPIALPSPEIEETPHTAPPAFHEEAPTTIDAAVAPVAVDEAPPDEARPRRKSKAGPTADVSCAKSDVDDLLARFGVSSLATPDSMQKTRASLKRLAGLDPTPPPPTAAELRRLTARPPNVAPERDRTVRLQRPSAPEAPIQTQPPRPFFVALVAVGLVLAGLLGHYLPSWLEDLRAETPNSP